MSIHNGHRQRVKSTFMDSQFKTFQPHEILEFLLFFSIPQGNTNETAHGLIKQYGDIASVFDAPFEELIKVKGIGENSATLLKAIPYLSGAYLNSTKKVEFLESSEHCMQYLTPYFMGKNIEILYIVFLDNKSSVIACEQLSEGSVNHTHVDLSKIVRLALKHNASSAILSHNHPNGTINPSSKDVAVTKKVTEALGLIKINLVDHIIVCGLDYYSFLDNNLI